MHFWKYTSIIVAAFVISILLFKMVCLENARALNYLNQEKKKERKKKKREKETYISRRRRRLTFQKEKIYIPKDILYQSTLFSWLCIRVSKHRYDHCKYLKQKLCNMYKSDNVVSFFD